MTTVSSAAPDVTPERRGRRARLLIPNAWTALAVSVIWLVVLLDALFGPDIVSSSPGNFTRVPSAIVVAFFAWLSTWVLARHGFSRASDEAE